MMKVLCIASLLVAIACLDKGHCLWCYQCEDEPSNQNCLKMAKCAKADKFCVTTVIAAGRGQSSEQQITKACSPNCTEHKVDTGIASVATRCCTSSFCNFEGE
nr:PREDICTED: lymphocyte antigen 6E-like [Anolis carolinensis]|eukprot:XP_016850915.1 PREDICTED: lymphocyte antigen 6E-like [Anolis carolinensis]